jgi:hypothetical protein
MKLNFIDISHTNTYYRAALTTCITGFTVQNQTVITTYECQLYANYGNAIHSEHVCILNCKFRDTLFTLLISFIATNFERKDYIPCLLLRNTDVT